MKFRKLRISWSVGCAIACVLLIVLWVRSYRWNNQLSIPLSDTQVVGPNSFSGRISFGVCTAPEAKFMWPAGLKSERITDNTPIPGFTYGRITGIPIRTVDFVQVPYWFVFLLAAAVGAAPWISVSKRFSLRTLLIATTLVAVVLGLIVAVLRWPTG
jgi:hypothetical protein